MVLLDEKIIVDLIYLKICAKDPIISDQVKRGDPPKSAVYRTSGAGQSLCGSHQLQLSDCIMSYNK